MSVHELFPYMRVSDAESAIRFYKDVFGATEGLKLVEPGGRVGHVELDFGGTVIMISDAFPEYGMPAPDSTSEAFVAMHLHVDDADSVIARAVEKGATIVHKLEDHFYGERSGRIRDPFNQEWIVGHSIEEVSPEEMQRRYTAMFSDS